MTRTKLWLCMIVGGLIYQSVKPLVGVEPNWETLINATYWTGAALMMHRLLDREEGAH